MKKSITLMLSTVACMSGPAFGMWQDDEPTIEELTSSTSNLSLNDQQYNFFGQQNDSLGQSNRRQVRAKRTRAPRTLQQDTQQQNVIKQQPTSLVMLESHKEAELFAKASKGDLQVQKELVERNYWGFLDKSHQSSLWISLDRYAKGMNILSWQHIENKAIEDDQYAYALIIEYEHARRWGLANQSFAERFPDLYRTIQKRAKEEDPSAQFILGVMCMKACVQGPDPRSSALEWIKKAATQGHALAISSLGWMAQRGFVDPNGRHDVEALRWYLESKNNKISQEVLRNELLIYTPSAPREEGTFKGHIESITGKLGFLLGEHSMQIGLHNPEGSFSENRFAIPKLSKTYQQVVELEEEAMGILESLENANPGFMITNVVLKERRDRAAMMSRQTQPPYVSVNEMNKMEYLTFGEKNVLIATKFLTYLNELEEKFSKADDILQKDSKSYKMRLDNHFRKLKETRLMCLKYQKLYNTNPNEKNTNKLEKHTMSFNKQTKKYAKTEPILTAAFQKIEGERTLLAEVKEEIQKLITTGVGRRNCDFLEANSYLWPQ